MNAPAFPASLFLLFLSVFGPVLFPVITIAKPQPFSFNFWPFASSTLKVTEEKAAELKVEHQKSAFVDYFLVHSDIRFRYSRTKVTSNVVNPSFDLSDEVKFDIRLPDTAFISKFSM